MLFKYEGNKKYQFVKLPQSLQGKTPLHGFLEKSKSNNGRDIVKPMPKPPLVLDLYFDNGFIVGDGYTQILK